MTVINESVIIVAMFGALSTVFWYWMRARDKRLDKLESEQNRIKDNYQKLSAAERDFSLIMKALDDIKNNTQRISDKLDKKADK